MKIDSTSWRNVNQQNVLLCAAGPHARGSAESRVLEKDLRRAAIKIRETFA